jgi:CRISPR-associated protein Cmr2
MASVLLVSIGPVQDFIASARRCGDLWYGSWLLSELAKAAANGIVGALGEEGLEALIFPGATARASLSPGSNMAVANKILARVPGVSANDIAEAGRAGMASRRDELAQDAFADIGKGDPDRNRHFLEKRAWAQIADLVEYTWVAVREPDGTEGYARARREAERILDARKGTKLWGQPSWSDSVRKSSLDGVRESVLHEDLFGVAQRDPARGPEWLRREYGVRASERLCGVGLLKRAGVREDGHGQGRRARFFSTPHVAALPLMARCANQGDAFERYAAVLRKAFGPAADDVLEGAPESFPAFGRADGQIFFSRRLDELAEESAAHDAQRTGLESAKRALSQFFRDTGTSEPRPYYAMLLADGDRMGRAIDAATTFADHRELSLCLASFATSAAKLVKEHDGSLLYAGGDDVLALLPLHTALACASALRRDFAGKLSAFAIPGGGSPTLSVGLGISHYIEPMDAALDLARRSERLAKGETRNALAVILEKRGGSPIEVRGPWEEQGDGAAPLAARLEAMIEMHRHDEVPDKAAFELAALGAQLRGSAPQLVAAETRRILARKQPRHGGAAQIAKDHRADLETWGLTDPVRLANELLVAREFADARDLAEGPVTRAKVSA